MSQDQSPIAGPHSKSKNRSSAITIAKYRTVLYFAVSIALGVAGALTADLSGSGLLLGSPAVVLFLALIWLVCLFGSKALSRNTKVSKRVRDALFLSVGSVGVIFSVWFVASGIIPDAASVYFNLRRAYITAHWMTDSDTGTVYYPLEYTFSDQGRIPLYFFVHDERDQFKFFPYSDQLSSPGCPNAKYVARKVYDHVYLLRAFIDDPREKMLPCLVTPSPVESIIND